VKQITPAAAPDLPYQSGLAATEELTMLPVSARAADGSATAQSRPKSPFLKKSGGLARHIIQFDPEDGATYAPFSLPAAAIAMRTARNPIPWPDGRVPTPAPLAAAPPIEAPLPQFDYLVVTWTVEEGKCLADTLTPGYPSRTAWYDYAHNFATDYLPLIGKGAPARAANRLGSWFPTVIGGKRVMCFKSELHMSQDGPKLPVAKLWQQLIAEVQPKLVITTGTAGGIGAGIELGDVIIARSVRFDCMREFKTQPFHASSYVCSVPNTASLPVAAQLFSANAAHLPPTSRPVAIFIAPTAQAPLPDVVTTDFFAFDDTSNTFNLQGMGAAVEMGDAVLGMVIEELGASAPRWLAVRNASDPEIDSAGLTEKEAAAKAAQIYERFGYWTTIPSAITCWALILDN
jgi:Phosphorylase superfamily